MPAFRSLVVVSTILALTGSALAHAPQGGKQNEVKGQAQMSGIYGRFGETYTMKSGINLTMIAASYQLEPFICYDGLTAKKDTKLVVLQFSMKNATDSDNDRGVGAISLIDEAGGKYDAGDGSGALQSKKAESFYITLKPGQGIGQPELKDPYRVGFVVPADAKITKIVINMGRKGKDEEVLRYLVAGTDKIADAKNIIKPLPVEARDTSDPTGAVAAPAGKGTIGKFLPSGPYDMRLDSIAAAPGEKMDGNDPEDGKVYWIAKVTVHNASYIKESLFDALSDEVALVDGDGDKYAAVASRKPTSDAAVDSSREMPFGEDYSFRIYILAPKDAKMKSFLLNASGGHVWKFDLPVAG